MWRTAEGLRIAAACAVLAGCGSASDGYRERGLAYACDGRIDEAIAELRLAVAADPRDAKAHAALGRIELRAGRPGAALRELLRASELGDDSIDEELRLLRAERDAARAARRRAEDAGSGRGTTGAAAGLDVAGILVAPDDAAATPGERAERAALRSRVARWWGLLDELPRDAARPIVARWREQVSPDALDAWSSGVRAGAPLGDLSRLSPTIAPGCADDAARRRAWNRVRVSVTTELALADRLAREYVDGDIDPICRGRDVVALFAAIGDAKRALAWADELLAVEPDAWRVATSAAEIAARARDAPRAHQYLVEAEYAAGEQRGVPSLVVARAWIGEGNGVEAISASRQAVALAGPRVRAAAHERLIASALVARRIDDARRAWERYRAELEPEAELAALARIRGEHGASVASLDPPDGGAWTRFLDGLIEEAPHVYALRARAELEPAGSPRRGEILATLLLVGLLDDTPRGADALEAAADLAASAGLTRLSRGARAEAAIVRAMRLAP